MKWKILDEEEEENKKVSQDLSERLLNDIRSRFIFVFLHTKKNWSKSNSVLKTFVISLAFVISFYYLQAK